MISKITSLSEYNSLFIQKIIDSKDSFLPLDQLTSDSIKNDRIIVLRSIYESISSQENDYDFHVNFYNSNYGPLSEDIHFPLSRSSNGSNAYVYPYSRTNFIDKYYSNILPSLVNKALIQMKDSNRIISIGSGAGKCVIIYPDLFDEEEYTQFSSTYNYSQAVLDTVNIHSLLASQQADINSLIKQNQILTDQIKKLESENIKISVARAEDYLTTWR